MPPEFWFEQDEGRPPVMHAPGIALVFSQDRGLGHSLHVEAGPAGATTVRVPWLVQSARSADLEIDEAQGRRIANPVYQEIVPHEPTWRTPRTLRLLTGSCFHHHFSAVFSIYRDPAMPRSIVLDVDVADRCRGSIETLAATYDVSSHYVGTDMTRLAVDSVAWPGADSGGGLLELFAVPPASIEEPAADSSSAMVRIQAQIDPKTHTQRLRYRWRWTSNSVFTR